MNNYINAALCLLVGVLMTFDVYGADGAFYAEVGAGYNTSLGQRNPAYQWEDAGSPGFYGTVRYELMLDRDRLGLVFHYLHVSQWFAGPPFNDRAESSLDHVGVAVRWRLTK